MIGDAMITKLRLLNFKPFRDSGDLDFRPLTVLAGPNSGGKTSILQSLLLLKQSAGRHWENGELNLDGRFLTFAIRDEAVAEGCEKAIGWAP